MNAFFEDLGSLADGLGMTLLMLLAAGAGSILVGALVAVARISPLRVLRGAAFVYVQFFINVPLLALLILAVFALPAAGFILPIVPTAIIVLTTYESAYVAEALRSGVNTVPQGQIEAARALGLTFGQSLRLVIVPQAFRAVVQPLGNIMIALAMNTSLTAVVGVVELTAHVNKVNLVYAQPVLFYTTGGLVYMGIALIIGLLAGRFERKLAIVR
ncbi:amino acid ABC transporter permease [Sinomonas sp. ASV322]|uniref:amino acid ABC transporter permease n=1 Tax=Sinomonas sp. ASV322 TaxID=3041920 RepID=UPI0027DDE203|nr:amino acid ABC transporter permease [Sinomonas sp. ASV322]MDQ4503016.1 amino acid ABC transporter permease [Sinomonas sp. ASV322]